MSPLKFDTLRLYLVTCYIFDVTMLIVVDDEPARRGAEEKAANFEVIAALLRATLGLQLL